MQCDEHILLSIDIPQTKGSMCRTERTISLGRLGSRTISVDLPCILVRTCKFQVKLTLCYPSGDEISSSAKEALGECIAAGIGAAIAAVAAAPEPTGTVAITAFNQAFDLCLQIKPGEVIYELKGKISCKASADTTDCGEWRRV